MTTEVTCAKCERTQAAASADDLVGWSWETVTVNGESSTVWRCSEHPAHADPDHEAPEGGW